MLFLLNCFAALAMAGDFDPPWQAYHVAGDPAGREIAWARLREQGWPSDFDATLARLRRRDYEAQVPRGELHLQRSDLDGRVYRYTVLIPEGYDPLRSYPLQVVLHGSTRRSAWRDDEQHWRWLGPFRSDSIISVFPAAWEDAMWWTQRQIENLSAILDRLRASYHIDSNRCYLTGLSDGGTGTFYHALRAPTPWAAFLPLIGHPWVLGNPQEGVDGDIFAANLHGRSLLAVNGREDRLYPAAALEPYLDLFERAGAHIDFLSKPGGHTVRWWPEEAENFAAYRAKHPRDPFPDSLVLETDRLGAAGRVNWLLIEELGEEPTPEPDPLNTVLFPDLEPPTRAEAFPRRALSGRVRVERVGNELRVETRNVRRLRLLLGVGEFDFEQPITVILNGRRSDHDVLRSLETMMKWALLDGDPELLVAAELALEAQD